MYYSDMNKTALITGATSGIGAAFARLLAAEGYALILHGRREGKLNELARELTATAEESGLPMPEKVQIVIGDLGKRTTLDRLIEAGRKGQVDMLINNAGYGSGKDFFDDDDDMQLNMITVHCQAPALLCRELIPQMIKRGSGQIINVSSLAGTQRLPQAILYASSKTFLTVFSESLSIRVEAHGVVVQALVPGFTHSDFHDRIPEWMHEKRSRGIMRWQRAEDVAAHSLRMLRKKWPKAIVVSGFFNRLIVFLTSVFFANTIGRRLYRHMVRKMLQ